MKLIKCFDCQNPNSPSVMTCPKCGRVEKLYFSRSCHIYNGNIDVPGELTLTSAALVFEPAYYKQFTNRQWIDAADQWDTKLEGQVLTIVTTDSKETMIIKLNSSDVTYIVSNLIE